MRRLLLCCALVSAAATAAAGQGLRSEGGETRATAKPAAAPFSVTSLGGKKISLESLRGKVVVLNFWFAGCQPCVAEIPELNKLVSEFKDRDVVFLALTWDDAATARSFLSEVPFNYEIVPGAADVIIGSYGKGGEIAFPAHYVIDRGGAVEFKSAGSKELAALRATIKRLADSPSK